MDRKSISAYLGGIVDLLDIGKSRTPNFYFEASEELTGTFVFKIWNSDKKTTEYPTTGVPLVKVGNILTLTFDATAWSLPAGNYYYEIIETTENQVYFKGTAQIIQ